MPNAPQPTGLLTRFIVAFVVLSAGVAYIIDRFDGDWHSEAARDRMGYALGPVLLLSYFLASRYAIPAWQHLKRMGVWVLFMLILVVLYSFRAELGTVQARVVAAVMPARGFATQPGTLSFYRSSNGHFYIEARVNGHPVRFLVDTGASDIVLNPHAARTLGFHPDTLHFSRTYQTANGQGRGAPVQLETFQVGDLVLRHLPASVNRAPMRHSLLGMRFFNRLTGFQIQKERLTIRWP